MKEKWNIDEIFQKLKEHNKDELRSYGSIRSKIRRIQKKNEKHNY